jgi:phosphate-selective porin OprO and OprP
MSQSPRRKVYNPGRVSILMAVACSCFGLSARAQETATPPAAPLVTPPTEEAPPAQPTAPAAPPVVLQQRLDDIDQQTRIVARKLELAQEAAEARRKETPVIVADDGGFGIASANKDYQLRLRGLVQLDARRFFGDDSLRDRDTFVVRRIRPIFAGTVLGLADFLISPDFGNNTTVVTDAYIDVHPRPWLRLRAGKFKAPLGLERLQSDQDLVFIERALDANLTAQREIGLQLWGDILGGLVRYEAGVYNGVPDGTLLDVDSDYSKTFGGRLFIQPFATESLRALGRLGVGFAASTGYEKGSPAAGGNTWVPTFRSAGQNTIYSYLASSTDANATVFALNRHTRLNPQLYYYFGPIGLLAEWVKEYQELAKGPDDGAVNHSAGHVTLAYVIGGDETYEGLKPRKPIDLAAGTFGAVEIAARYSWIDFDDVSFPTLADKSKSVTKAQELGAAINWAPSRNLKVMGDWQRTSFNGGAPGGANRKTENVAIGRFQVAF